MVDNFNLIAEIIRKKSLNSGDFFFLEILKRKKDNPLLSKHVVMIDNWHIRSADDLLEKKDSIVEQCNLNNARAYIRLNKRSEEKVALETLKLVAVNISNKNYNIKSCYHSACGQCSSDPEKTWIIDLDWNEIDFPVEKFIEDIAVLKRAVGMDDTTYVIPTKNGCHVITRPFHLDKFNKLGYNKISMHKDNPTILYQP